MVVVGKTENCHRVESENQFPYQIVLEKARSEQIGHDLASLGFAEDFLDGKPTPSLREKGFTMSWEVISSQIPLER